MASSSTPNKLHPHLKSFIRSIVATEFEIPQHAEDSWKEQVLTLALNRVVGRLDSVQNLEDYHKSVELVLQELQQEFLALSHTTEQVIKGIPLELLKIKSKGGSAS